MEKNEKKITATKTVQVLLVIAVAFSAILAIKGMFQGSGELFQKGCILGGMNATLLSLNVCDSLKKRRSANS